MDKSSCPQGAGLNVRAWAYDVALTPGSCAAHISAKAKSQKMVPPASQVGVQARILASSLTHIPSDPSTCDYVQKLFGTGLFILL